MSHETHESQVPGELAADISRMMVRLLREHTGRGPTKARTTVGRDHVLVAVADTLTRGERTLVEGGYTEDVLRARRRFQDIMKPTAMAEVERLTGRKVAGFMSDNHIDPDMGVEVFLLEPSANGDGPTLVEGDGSPA